MTVHLPKRFVPLLVLFVAAILLFALANTPVHAATLPSGFSETLIANSLSNPTAFAFAPDGRIFVTQQGGALRVIKNNTLLATPFVTLTVDSTGERGLLGVAFDPDFANNQYVYVYYTVTSTPRHNRVSRFTANGDVAAAGETILVELDDLGSATNHNGGAIHFGSDDKLYIAVGENANTANAQTLANRHGKILRYNPDGTIPADNPFYGTATGENRSIWALGLRNPFTFAFQPTTGRMFINDVGAGSREEINDGIAGSNYGWSICEGFCNPPNAAYRDPLFAYTHSGGAFNGCAIVGGAFYNPTTLLFPADYAGDYFFADLCSGWIRKYDIATNTSTEFATGISSPVDLHVTNDGALYYLARGAGAVMRVTYTAPTNTATPTATSTATRTATQTATRTATHTATRTTTPNGSWTFCANENQNCSFTGTRQVRYGANGIFAYRIATNSIACNNATFGDPIPGVKKKCEYSNALAPTATLTPTATTAVGTWTFCANENKTCSFTGTRQVRYGANGKFAYRTATNSIACNNATFGDPIPGTVKKCHYNSFGASAATSRDVQRRGVRGTYFDDTTFGATQFTRLDEALDFDIDPATDAALADTPFSVRWNGTLRARHSETYTFTLETTGGARLWIDDTLVIDAADNQSRSTLQGTVNLQAKKRHTFRLEYTHAGGHVLLRLLWQSPHQKQQIIPASALRPGK